MTDDETVLLAWMAGVFEGEGNIYISEPNDRTAGVLEVSVGNCDTAIVEPFNERYEGHVRVNNPNRPDNWRELVKWSASAAQAVEPLEELHPYFRSDVETRRAKLALEIQSIKDDWYHSGKKTKEKAKRHRERLDGPVSELREINGNRG